MGPFLKGVLQGSIPVIVIVGGTHHLVKRFKETRPVVYWGSLAVAAGLTYAVVQGKIKVPFMNAENQEMIEISDIDWETDGEDPEEMGLPSTVMVPSDLEEDEIADYLSDNYGFLVNGFVVMGAETFEAEGVSLNDKRLLREMAYDLYDLYGEPNRGGEWFYTSTDGERFEFRSFEDEAIIYFRFDLDERIYGLIDFDKMYDDSARFNRYVDVSRMKDSVREMGEEHGREATLRIDRDQNEGWEESFCIEGQIRLKKLKSKNSETFEARENKDGTIVLTDNEWNSCRHIGFKDHYLFGNKELKLKKHLKTGVKFEVVKIHSDEVMAIIREYEDFLNKRGYRNR